MDFWCVDAVNKIKKVKWERIRVYILILMVRYTIDSLRKNFCVVENEIQMHSYDYYSAVAVRLERTVLVSVSVCVCKCAQTNPIEMKIV